MPELERWVLHRVSELDKHLRQSCRDYDFHGYYQAVHNFCALDLSAFYLDIRKDSLYCDGEQSLVRRACRTVMDILFDCLTAWLAPILVFTCEEAWLARNKAGGAESVHLRQFMDIPAQWRDDDLAVRWAKIRDLRRVMTGALERERAQKTIGSSLQARVSVFVECPDLRHAIEGQDLAEIAITSQVEIVSGPAPEGAFFLSDCAGVGVVVTPAQGEKCPRCWKVSFPVVQQNSPQDPSLCERCASVLESGGF